MKFTLHYDDGNHGGPGQGWWRYIILAVALIILVMLIIVARAM